MLLAPALQKLEQQQKTQGVINWHNPVKRDRTGTCSRAPSPLPWCHRQAHPKGNTYISHACSCGKVQWNIPAGLPSPL